MKKRYVVKSKKEFNTILKNNNKYKNQCFIVHYINNNLEYSRFGIAVSKKIGNAVVRNKFKRQIRNIVDNNINLFQNNRDYIIIMRNDIKKTDFKILSDSLVDIIEKVK